MSQPARFLGSFAKLISTMGLYRPGHPAREQALDTAFGELRTLLEEAPRPVFSFIEGEVVYGEQPLRELREWEWATRLAEIGVERVEMNGAVTRGEFESFLDEIHARLTLPEFDIHEREFARHTSIRFGPVTIRGVEKRDDLPTATMGLNLREEAQVVGWLHGEAGRRGEVPVDEAEAVVRLLSVAMHSERELVVPLVQLKEVDQYTTTHSINASVLSMALSEFLNLASTDVRAVGEAALLHDVGKSRIPVEILNKPGKLSRDEWEIVKHHTVEGAHILLKAGGRLELAAIVAYEHHLTWKGEGYPVLHYPRQPHRLSRLIQVCDIYDALRTRRPFRPPWSVAQATHYLEEHSGEQLDPEFVSAFLTMIQQWEPRLTSIDEVEETRAAG
ncbi:MAG: HD-GYP domain-containing protein [Gemmatimonadota bacterium]